MQQKVKNCVRLVRQSKGLSQDAVGKKIGKARGQISRIEKGLENGGGQLTQNWLNLLSYAMDCTPAELIGYSPMHMVPAAGDLPLVIAHAGEESHERIAFDLLFDEGEDVSTHLDLKQASRPGLASKRVNVDFPEWMVRSIDAEAQRLGITRESLIKVWISERLESPHKAK